VTATSSNWPSAARLVAVGLGPGNPDYVTVRAVKLLRAADRLVHFAKRGERGVARTIADSVIGPDPGRELPLYYPVTTEIPLAHPDYAAAICAFHDKAAACLIDEIAAGRSVAVLCEGDPFFYGSFTHLWLRLRDRFAIEIVPGITGMAGAGSHAGVPIGWADDVLTVIPATLRYAALVERLGSTDAAVIIKLGRNLSKVRDAIAAAGLLDRAIYVERATMPRQRICPLADMTEDTAPYFSLILMPGRGRRD
jgi:precorrin-2/cobalt-factor-2 C20-methyltransferase